MTLFNQGFIWISEARSAADMNKDFHIYIISPVSTTEDTEITEL
jgi:hypothetical protein